MTQASRGMMAVVIGLVVVPGAAAAEELSAAPAEPVPAASMQAGAGNVVYTFADEASLNEFQELWRQRQGLLLRMSVLEAYWDEGQAALAELDRQLASRYQLDLMKNYVYDSERKAIVEQASVPPASLGAPLAPELAQPSSSPAEIAPSTPPQ